MTNQHMTSKKKARYTVRFRGRAKGVEIYRGNSERIMYSHVSAMEYILMDTLGTGDIEIIEDGKSRWIDYRDGVRDGFPESATWPWPNNKA